MIDYLKEFEDKGFFTCADILNESEREELLSNIDQIERNVLGHPENKKEMDPNNTSRLRKINDLTLNHQYFFEISTLNFFDKIASKTFLADSTSSSLLIV